MSRHFSNLVDRGMYHCITLFAICSVLLLCAALLDFSNIVDVFNNLGCEAEDKSFEKVGHLLLLFVAIITALMAYLQFVKLNRTAWGNLLAKLEQRYGSGEILEARKILHKIKIKYKNNDDPINSIQTEIANLRNKTDDESVNSYILIYNLLEFFESISYYEKIGYIDFHDVCEMFADISTLYSYFAKLIIDLDPEQNNHLFYEVKRLSEKCSHHKPTYCWYCRSRCD